MEYVDTDSTPEHSTAADFIDRALFTYERAFVGSFNFTSGLNRLDFDRVENRPFFLAVHRQISDLQRRGCVRTAFEFARLLYSLDPATDPHGALLHLDYLSIKAGMSDWLIELWRAQCNLPDDSWKGRMHVRALPGFAYSRALALFLKARLHVMVVCTYCMIRPLICVHVYIHHTYGIYM